MVYSSFALFGDLDRVVISQRDCKDLLDPESGEEIQHRFGRNSVDEVFAQIKMEFVDV